jgi:small subunit ribosomal protein S20
MAITKSAKKAIRQSRARRARNIKKKKEVRGALKEIQTLLEQKKTKEAKTLLPQVYKLLDKAAKTGLIKKNKATRTKSRVTKLLNKSG